jgi:tetratricopeptide (TPR) repeat protein
MTVPLSVLSALASAILAVQAAPPAQDPAERVKLATGLELNDGKRAEAAAIYREILAAHPSNVDAHLGLGRILVVEGTIAEGRRHLDSALAAASDTQRGAVLSTMAIAHVFEGNAKAAATVYEQVFDRQLKANALSPAANTANALGRTLLESGDLDGAEKWYRLGHETAARIQNVPAQEADLWAMRLHHAQGRIAARRGRFDAAREHLAAVEALVAKGTLPEGQRAFAPQLAGYIAFYQGRDDEAIAALAKADQQDPFVLSLLAQAHERKKDAARARELYERVMARPGYSLQLALTRPLAARRLAGR